MQVCHRDPPVQLSRSCPHHPLCRWWNQHDDRGNDPPSGQQQRGGGYKGDDYGAGYGSSSSRGNSSAAAAATSGWSNAAPYHQQAPAGYGAPQGAAGSGYGQQGGSGYGQAAGGGGGAGGYGQQQASYQQQPGTGSALNPEADPYQSAAPVSRVSGCLFLGGGEGTGGDRRGDWGRGAPAVCFCPATDRLQEAGAPPGPEP